MNSLEWEAAARALAHDHGRRPTTGGSQHRLVMEPERLLLAEIDGLIREAPDQLHQAFVPMTEGVLGRGANSRANAISRSRYGWGPRPPGDAVRWFIAAIAQARALDLHLSADADLLFGEHPRGDYGLIPDLGVYVLPRRAARLDGSVPKDGEPYSRRGLLHHRVIPARVCGMPVAVTYLPVPPPSPPERPQRFGAALFGGGPLATMPARLPHGPEGFLAASFEIADDAKALGAHLAQAHRSGCRFAVWPELTMPPARRDELGRMLALEAVGKGAGSALEVAVAGSWHERDGTGHWRNVAVAFDRFGDERARHSKLKPYFRRDVGVECIEPGIEFQLIATSQLVIGIGICKDVCDLARPSPYLDLPIDLLLVPSMGGIETATAHVKAAEPLRLRNGTMLFVVQQGEDPESAGYVVCSATPTKGKSILFRQSKPWRAY